MAVSPDGDYFVVTDSYSNRVRKVNITSGNIATLAGDGDYNYDGNDGLATAGGMRRPYGVAVDHIGDVYFSDEHNKRIRKASNGIISSIAGTGVYGFHGEDVLATTAKLRNPYGVCRDKDGNIYFADKGNHRVRMINISNSKIYTVAGISLLVFLSLFQIMN